MGTKYVVSVSKSYTNIDFVYDEWYDASTFMGDLVEHGRDVTVSVRKETTNAESEIQEADSGRA